MHAKSLSLKENFPFVLKETLKISLFVFLLALSSRIRVYLPYSPVPVTFQTLVVYLSVIFIGRGAVYALFGYLMLGISGVPVFAAGEGFGYLLGPTGGYLAGFLLASMILANILYLKKNILWHFLCFCLADAIILFMGSFWLSRITAVSMVEAASLGILPFIYGDCLKIALAVLTTQIVKPRE